MIGNQLNDLISRYSVMHIFHISVQKNANILMFTILNQKLK